MTHELLKGNLRMTCELLKGNSRMQVYAGCNANTRVWHASCNAHSRVCNPKSIIKIYKDGLRKMHQSSFPSIVFRPLQSKLSFCVPTWGMSALRRRSAILVDNRCPLMCEVRGKRWSKYIIIIILENSEVQGSRGSTWNKYISNFIYKIISKDSMFNILEH